MFFSRRSFALVRPGQARRNADYLGLIGHPRKNYPTTWAPHYNGVSSITSRSMNFRLHVWLGWCCSGYKLLPTTTVMSTASSHRFFCMVYLRHGWQQDLKYYELNGNSSVLQSSSTQESLSFTPHLSLFEEALLLATDSETCSKNVPEAIAPLPTLA